MSKIPKEPRKTKKTKEVEVIEHAPGTKTVARKTSWVKRVKLISTLLAIIWLGFVVWAPLYIKNHYSEPIKKSIVVSMFFDLQRYMQEQYEKMLKGIAGAIDLSKPIGIAIDKVKMVGDQVAKVEDVSNQATKTTDDAKKATDGVKGLTGIANKFGINTGAVDKVVDSANSGIDSANKAIAKVDDTTKLVNDKLDKVKTDLEKVAQTEIDKAMDEQIKKFLDKQTGGLGTTFLTNYGIKHVMPWKPSTWPITTKIYNDLQKSDVGVITSLTSMVNKYYGYVAWGIVIAMWLLGLFILSKAMGYVKQMIAPFVVCPRCGYTFTDKKKLSMGLLKIFQPWKWIGI